MSSQEMLHGGAFSLLELYSSSATGHIQNRRLQWIEKSKKELSISVAVPAFCCVFFCVAYTSHMKFTTHFVKTSKDVPAGVASKNAELLIRAGFIHQEMAGVYSYLPLGLRVLEQITQVVREEMNMAGCIEMKMPSLCPKQNWEKTNRWEGFDVLYKLETSHGDAALCPTHEEVITPLVQRYLSSYKDFPVCLYQFQNKFRNEPRAKSGLLRCREFLMKDAYSFHTSQADFEQFYDRMKVAYDRVFERLGIGNITTICKADGGAFSRWSHEYQTFHPVGEDTIFYDPETGEAWNKEVAVGTPDDKNSEEPAKEKEQVVCERAASIKASCDAMGIEPWQVLKHVVFADGNEKPVIVATRGDLEVNKLFVEAEHGSQLKPATTEQLAVWGMVSGFISVVGTDHGAKVYADESVRTAKNYVTGANAHNADFVNINENDLMVHQWGQYTFPKEGFLSTNGNPLKTKPAVEVGNIFPLATKFSDAFSFTYMGDDGTPKPVIMGCYGIGVSRLMGVIAEVYADEKGLSWPAGMSPADVHIIAFGKADAPYAAAEELYSELIENGITPLYDNRNEKKVGFGQKMAEADLIGVPVRVVITERTLESGEFELSRRDEDAPKRVKIEDIIQHLS